MRSSATVVVVVIIVASRLFLGDGAPIRAVDVRDSALASIVGSYAREDLDPDDGVDDASSRCRPRQIHLSVGIEPWSSVTVSFSIPRTCELEHARVLLRCGPVRDREDDDRVLELAREGAHVARFNYTSTNIHYTLYRSDHLYHVSLTSLRAATRYRYRIVVENENDGVELTSSVSKEFRTTAMPGGERGSRMAVVADIGQTVNATVTMLRMYQETMKRSNDDNNEDEPPVSLVLCGGDCSYSDANPTRWDSWFTLIEPLASRVPLQVAVGNHECECDAETFEMSGPYEHRYRMPNETPSVRSSYDGECRLPRHKDGRLKETPLDTVYDYDYGNSYYDFVHELTHVVVLNCYAPSHAKSRQYAWFRRVLETKVDRAVSPWLLVMVHCSFYNTFRDHRAEANAVEMFTALEPLFVTHGVNVVVSGHAHGYSRSRGVAHNVPRTAAPVYVVVGVGGSREGHSPGYKHDEPEDWCVARDLSEFGFATIHFVNATTAHWRWIPNDDHHGGFTDEAYLENQFWHLVESARAKRRERMSSMRKKKKERKTNISRTNSKKTEESPSTLLIEPRSELMNGWFILSLLLYLFCIFCAYKKVRKYLHTI